jgi:hypothetical protein
MAKLGIVEENTKLNTYLTAAINQTNMCNKTNVCIKYNKLHRRSLKLGVAITTL